MKFYFKKFMFYVGGATCISNCQLPLKSKSTFSHIFIAIQPKFAKMFNWLLQNTISIALSSGSSEIANEMLIHINVDCQKYSDRGVKNALLKSDPRKVTFRCPFNL